MIKVLMLGWEFPPYISGGLGVACEGLTSALIRTEEVEILFVIPQAPEATRDHLSVVGANTIKVPSPGSRMDVKTGSVIVENELNESHLDITPMEACLDPYQPVGTVSSEREYLTKWNSSIDVSKEVAFEKKIDTTYKFDGGYGRKLLQEVDRYAEVLMSFALEKDFDVIHAHDWMTIPAGVAIKRASGKPLVVHIHATEFDRAGTTGSNIVYDIERMGIEKSDKVLSVSEHTRRVLVEKYGADAHNITVVHNGINATSNPDLSPKAHPLGEQLVSFVGRITFQKGPEYFVDAAEKVLREFPHCHFVMAGAGDALPEMIKRVIGKRMSSNFHFTGFLGRAEVDRLLQYSRVYVMPSVSEPFGLTALEAVNAGVPSVISLQSGVSEVLPDVIKVDFWDTDALARAICGVLRYPVLAETMRQRARNNVTSVTWESVAQKVINVYHELKHDDARRFQTTP